MSGMIERAAKAMYDFERAGTASAEQDWKTAKSHWVKKATIAFEAARELPEDVAGELKWHFDNGITYGTEHDVRFLWKEVIDAVVKPG